MLQSFFISFRQPPHPFIFIPFSCFYFSRNIFQSSDSMLFAILKWSFIYLSIRPPKSTLSFFLVILIFTLIFFSIWPGKGSFTLHLVLVPGSIKDSSVRPLIFALSLTLINYKLSSVSAPIQPFENTISIFQAMCIFSNIFATSRPVFFSKAVLFVILKLPLIRRSISYAIPFS